MRKKERGRVIETYLLLLGNYSIRSTDPLAVPYLSSSSTPSICAVRSQNIKRRGGGEERRRSRKNKNKNEIEGRVKPDHAEDILPCFQCVVDSFACCISHLSVAGR